MYFLPTRVERSGNLIDRGTSLLSPRIQLGPRNYIRGVIRCRNGPFGTTVGGYGLVGVMIHDDPRTTQAGATDEVATSYIKTLH